MIVLNHDNGEVVLTVTPPRRSTGVAIVLRSKFRTNEIAATAAAVMARRLGLRRRGTAWIRVNSK